MNFQLAVNSLSVLREWSRRDSSFQDLLDIFGSAMDQASAKRWLQAFSKGEFSGLPPVVTLSAERMPDLWGGYSREKNRIYLSVDCPPELVDAVLLEEIGHFLDHELCAEETPGEEGARFASIVLGKTPSVGELASWSGDEGWAVVYDGSGPVLVEGAKKKKSAKKSGSGGKRGKRGKKNKSGGSGKSKKKNKSKSWGSSEVSSRKVRLSLGDYTDGASPAPAEPVVTSPARAVPPIDIWADSTVTQTYAGETLTGSAGNNTFVVLDSDVTIIDTLGGNDVIESSADGLSLENFPKIPKLTLLGQEHLKATGNRYSNTLVGNVGNNSIDGGDGNDSIVGGDGNDTLIGGDGKDTLEGGDGDDSLDGGTNKDSVVGGAGDDTIVGDEDDLLLDGQEGDDWLRLASNFNDASDAQVQGIERVVISADGVSIDLAQQSESLDISVTASGVSLVAGSGADTFAGGGGADSVSGGSGADSIVGGGGGDTIIGAEDDELLDGGDGTDHLQIGTNFNDVNDAQIVNIEHVEVTAEGLTVNLGDQTEGVTITGYASGATNITTGAGADSIIGGNGVDTFSAGAGSDTIQASQRDALIDGGADTDWLKVGENFNDVNDAQIVDIERVEVTAVGVTLNLGDQTEGIEVTGHATGATTFVGGSGADTFIGGSGADSIVSGNGADNISAGAGNDTIEGGKGAALLDGGDGTDWLKIGANFENNGDTQILSIEHVVLTAAGLTLNLGDQTDGIAVTGHASGSSTFVGGSGADTFVGGSGEDSIAGGAGADSVIAGAGNDTIVGSEDDAKIDGGAGADWLQIGADFDDSSDAQIVNIEKVELTAGGLTVNLGDQSEGFAVTGHATGSSTFVGGSGADTFVGGTGADSIAGGDGADSISAGAGNDTIVGAKDDALIDGGEMARTG